MHDNSDREDAERHAQGEEDAVSEIGEVFHRDVVRAEKRGRDEATDVPEEDVGVVGGHDVWNNSDPLLLRRRVQTPSLSLFFVMRGLFRSLLDTTKTTRPFFPLRLYF